MRIALTLVLAVTLPVTRAQSVVNDRLQCFKITGLTLKSLKGTVNLNTPAIGLAPGCKRSKAKPWCPPASSTSAPCAADSDPGRTGSPGMGSPAAGTQPRTQTK